MDFNDLDSQELPAKAPAKTSRFAPRGTNNPRPVPAAKPKVEGPSTKPEPERHSDPTPSLNIEKEDTVEDVKPSLTSTLEPKNAYAKMEVEDKPEPMDEDIDLGDEVVREIDVYFNPSIGANTQLYVMQYPLRSFWRPYELDERCEKVRVKSDSAEVEVDLSIDAGSKNFDADSNSKFNMKKQILASRWTAPLVTSYAVGFLTGNKLHLNPVHEIVQLRPSMEPLKSDAASMKGNVSSSSAERVKKEESAESTKKQTQSKQLDHSNEEGADEGEKWIPLVYHGSKSDLAGRYLQKLTAHESTPIQFTKNPFDHFHSLCPGAADSNRKPGGAIKSATQLKQSSMAASKEARPANLDKAAEKSASGAGRRTMSDETREALPKALQKIFQNHKACSFELICQSLRDLAVSQSSLLKADPRMVIAARGADAPHAELKEVINIVATEIYGVYVSKSSPEHPEYDPLREVVIKLLIGKGPNASLKKEEIYEAAKKLKREISNNEYTKVMSELCESKGASWYLRKSN